MRSGASTSASSPWRILEVRRDEPAVRVRVDLERLGRRVERSLQDRGRPVVERVRTETSGRSQRSPCSASGSVRKYGEQDAHRVHRRAVIVEVAGRVSSPLRVPPPTLGFRLEHRHRRAACARRTAAARPFGPEPITTASQPALVTRSTTAGGGAARAGRARRRRGGRCSRRGSGRTASCPPAAALSTKMQRSSPGSNPHCDLHRAQQALLVMQVAVAEVPAQHQPGDQLALDVLVVLQRPVERPSGCSVGRIAARAGCISRNAITRPTMPPAVARS